jgi:hypothetical protein
MIAGRRARFETAELKHTPASRRGPRSRNRKPETRRSPQHTSVQDLTTPRNDANQPRRTAVPGPALEYADSAGPPRDLGKVLRALYSQLATSPRRKRHWRPIRKAANSPSSAQRQMVRVWTPNNSATSRVVRKSRIRSEPASLRIIRGMVFPELRRGRRRIGIPKRSGNRPDVRRATSLPANNGEGRQSKNARRQRHRLRIPPPRETLSTVILLTRRFYPKIRATFRNCKIKSGSTRPPPTRQATPASRRFPHLPPSFTVKN